jgi:hypothetical protein
VILNSIKEENNLILSSDFPEIITEQKNNDPHLCILKHSFFSKTLHDTNKEIAGVEIALKNISERYIGYTLLELTFYDKQNKVLEIDNHKIIEFDPGSSRLLRLNYSGKEPDKISKYQIKVTETLILPDPIAIGNDSLSIMHHEITEMKEDERKVVHPYGVKLAIRNNSNKKIATSLFEAIFFDINGNIVDKVTYKTKDLDAEVSRAINIYSTILEETKVKSYFVKVTKTITTDVEKIQICNCRAKSTVNGEEITVIFKNLSEIPISAVIMVDLFNLKDEIIGSRAMELDQINANEIRQCNFLFELPPGENLVRFEPNVVEIIQ